MRYYAVGEYGDENDRPHYHIALFNYPNCSRGQTDKRLGAFNCCSACRVVGETWGKGIIDIRNLDIGSASYVAGYITKKMTKPDDSRLLGREPEFSRMSLRPGIGAGYLHDAASSFLEHNLEQTQADVPSGLRHGRAVLPLGRYMTQTFRKLVGRDEKTPEVVKQKIQEKLQPVRSAAFDASRSLKEVAVEKSEGRRASIKARNKIYGSKRNKV